MHTDLGEVAAGVLHGDDRTHSADAVDHRLECQLLQLLLSCFMTRVVLLEHHAHILQVKPPCLVSPLTYAKLHPLVTQMLVAMCASAQHLSCDTPVIARDAAHRHDSSPALS